MDITDHELNFTGAARLPIMSVGRYLRVRESSSPVYISVDGSSELEREQGEQIDLGRDGMRVYVRSLIAQTVKITTSGERQDDNRTAVSLNVSATVEAGNDNQHLARVTVPAGGAIKIADANSDRLELRLSMLSSALDYVTLGKNGVTSTVGGTLEPGMVDYMPTKGELWAFNPHGSNIDVYVMEINSL